MNGKSPSKWYKNGAISNDQMGEEILSPRSNKNFCRENSYLTASCSFWRKNCYTYLILLHFCFTSTAILRLHQGWAILFTWRAVFDKILKNYEAEGLTSADVLFSPLKIGEKQKRKKKVFTSADVLFFTATQRGAKVKGLRVVSRWVFRFL